MHLKLYIVVTDENELFDASRHGRSPWGGLYRKRKGPDTSHTRRSHPQSLRGQRRVSVGILGRRVRSGISISSSHIDSKSPRIGSGTFRFRFL
jgi:hypothetical protein